jgi:hypothetical protein
VDVEELEVDEAGEVDFQLGVPPPRPTAVEGLTQLTAGEPDQRHIHRQVGRLLTDMGVDSQQQPAGLWGQLVERLPEHRMREAVGDLDIPDRRLHIRHLVPVDGRGLAGPLVLVQQRDRGDEVQVLAVVPPRPGPPIRERQPVRERIDDRQRFEEALRVPMQRHDSFSFCVG